jgi:hypothetical protein
MVVKIADLKLQEKRNGGRAFEAAVHRTATNYGW